MSRTSETGRSDERGYRRALFWGLMLSVGLHLMAFLLLDGFPVHVPVERGSAEIAGPGLADALAVVRLPEARAAAPAPVRRTEPVPAVRAPRPRRPVMSSETASARPVAFRFARGPAAGDGEDAGSGEEGEGSTGSGGAGRSQPVPRSILPQWDPPEAVRGMRVTVRVHVDARGRPSGPVELHPPTPDADFNEKLREKVRRMEYRPAREAGQPVAGWAEITFVF